MATVCVLTSAHTPFDTRIFHKQAKTLADAGYDVTVVGPHEADERRDDIQVKAVNPGDTHRRRLLNLFSTASLARRLDADVYHFHDPGLLPVGALLALTTDAKVVYDVHEDYEHAFRAYNFPPDWLTPLVVRGFPLVERAVARVCDAVVTADEPTAEKFRRRGHDPVVAIHNYPLTSDVSIDPRTDERDHEHMLAYVGSLQERRGLFEMLDLAAGLRENGLDVGLWLLGPIGGAAEQPLTEHIESTNLTDHVRLFGYVEYDQIFSYLAAADAGLVLLDPDQPDFATNIPTKLFEYMLAGLPVIASRLPTVEQYLPDDCGIVVEYGDTDQQVSAVSELLCMPDRGEGMGANGRKKVLEKFNWENEGEKLLDLYETLN